MITKFRFMPHAAMRSALVVLLTACLTTLGSTFPEPAHAAKNSSLSRGFLNTVNSIRNGVTGAVGSKEWKWAGSALSTVPVVDRAQKYFEVPLGELSDAVGGLTAVFQQGDAYLVGFRNSVGNLFVLNEYANRVRAAFPGETVQTIFQAVNYANLEGISVSIPKLETALRGLASYTGGGNQADVKTWIDRLAVTLAESARFPEICNKIRAVLNGSATGSWTVGAAYQTIITSWVHLSAGYFTAMGGAVGSVTVDGVTYTLSALRHMLALVKSPGRTTHTGQDWSVPRLTVMPLGDSITQGVGSSGDSLGYRKELSETLREHAGNLDFVGSLRNGDGGFDGDHEGHSGWRIDELTDNGYPAGDLDTWLPAAKPNVITLIAGTNDLNRGAPTTPEQARDRMDKLLGKIHAMAPDMTVLLGSVPPTDPTSGWARFQPLFTAYNRLLPPLVDAWRAKDMKVRFVDMGVVDSADMRGGDGLHPTAVGYTKIAGAFSEGLAQAAQDGWITETVAIAPAPPMAGAAGRDHQTDVDGDGKADYLVVGDHGEVTAYLNRGGDGNGGFVESKFASGPVGADPGNVGFADVNGDGKADYLVVGDGGQVTAWTNNGGDSAGGFAPAKVWAAGPAGTDPGRVRFADVNGDGRADYLVVSDQGQVRAWVSRGGDGFAGFDERPFASGPEGANLGNVRFADVDGDRKADYLIVRDNGAADVWINRGGDGAGGFAAARKFASGPAGADPGHVRFADINGDGRADYLIVGDSGQVTAWINNGGDSDQPGWIARGRIASGVGFPIHQTAFADIDGDGKADYLGTAYSWSSRPYEPCVWANRGGDGQGGWAGTGTRAECADPAGSSGMVRSTGSVPGYSSEQYADLNGDGAADRIIVNADNSVDAQLNTGGVSDTGRWGARSRVAGGLAPWGQVRFADVNGDGKADYLTVDENGRTMACLNQGMDGGGGWGPYHQIAAGPGGAGSGSRVQFADVNGDLRADYLLVADDGSVQAWLNDGGDGAGGWTAYGTLASGPAGNGSGRRVRFADVNGDLRADYLLVADDGSVQAWLNNGGNSGGWIDRGVFAAGVAPADRVRL
ncbi:FG-GAP-like repeat-containing protein [Kitasatospora sp. NPDC096204]|uniref:FG-GAP-like repeat-containing protein n=1 Tax=Kitasatospora sp. NPDC096204 TaxID=3364094 RepID=UPI003824BF7D